MMKLFTILTIFCKQKLYLDLKPGKKRNMINIFVINLKRSESRWRNIERQLKQSGLKADRFEAVDGHAGQHPLFSRYDDKLSRLWKGRPLSPGQLGCFASHFLIWEECVRLDTPVIAIEDDAVIEPSIFHDFLAAVESFPKALECIRLFTNHSKHHSIIPVRNYRTFSIVKYTKGPMRATGYFITPGGAAKFLHNAERWFLPVDITMDRFWINGVECYGIQPPCISNDPSFKSTIAVEDIQRKKRSMVLRLRRESFSAKESLAKSLHNFKFRVSLSGFWKIGIGRQ